jgi:signal transduction histidine kinase
MVAGLVTLHLLLVRDELPDADLLLSGVVSAAVMVASAAIGLLALFVPIGSASRRGADIACAGLDAIALVAVARITVDIDPTASIAWAFVLWVPFSIAVRSHAPRAILASALLAAFVLLASATAPGPLHQPAGAWTGTVVPALLVFVAGVATALATVSHHRSGQLVRRELRDEQDRSLRLREADQLKNTYLAAVSHELRTPLTSIMGFSMTLLDRPELDQQQRERMLRTVVAEAEHLEEILANLLDLDRLSRGKATLAPAKLDPAHVVRRAVDAVHRRSGRAIRLELDEDVHVYLDAAKVERIVENLVGNAVKYTPRDEEIVVAMRGEQRGITLRVDDRGPGVDGELRMHVFEPFRRGSHAGIPGSGIGLSLVDHFARMHGGRAWVEDRPGGGARFLVHLPSVGDGAPLGAGVEVVRQGQPAPQAPGAMPGTRTPAR